MRQVRRVWVDERNSLEVRFDDGGCSVQINGSSALKLAGALEYMAHEIRRLETEKPYPVVPEGKGEQK